MEEGDKSSKPKRKPRGRGRAVARTKKLYARALVACDGDTEKAAKKVGLTTKQISRYKYRDADFAELVNGLVSKLEANLAEEAIRRALDKKGTDKALFDTLAAVNPGRWDGRVRAQREANKGLRGSPLFNINITAEDLMRIRSYDPAFIDVTPRALHVEVIDETTGQSAKRDSGLLQDGHTLEPPEPRGGDEPSQE